MDHSDANTAATGERPAAIAISGVAVTRNGKDLISGIDLTVPAGTYWSILGPNGAGKTTMLKLMGAQSFPTTGIVEILGEQMGKVNTLELRKRIGHVDPRKNLGDITAYEAVLSGASGSNGYVQRFDYTEEMKQRTSELLELVGMGSRTDRRWPQMSQGERARTLIARALVTQPELLLLDEPSTGLDLPGRETLLHVVDRLREARPEVATVLITHHVEEIAASTTDVLLMKDGRILSSGPVDEALTAEKLGELYDMDVELHRVGGRWFAFQG